MENNKNNGTEKAIELMVFITTTCYVYILISLFSNTNNTTLLAVISMAISFFMKEKGVLFLMIALHKILFIGAAKNKNNVGKGGDI